EWLSVPVGRRELSSRSVFGSAMPSRLCSASYPSSQYPPVPRVIVPPHSQDGAGVPISYGAWNSIAAANRVFCSPHRSTPSARPPGGPRRVAPRLEPQRGVTESATGLVGNAGEGRAGAVPVGGGGGAGLGGGRGGGRRRAVGLQIDVRRSPPPPQRERLVERR